jgi:LPS-assembly lipoprotein
MWLSRARPGWLGGVLALSLAACLATGLAGCGFRFQGTPEFPPQMGVINIDATDRYSPFYRELVAVLRRSEVKLTDDPTQARTIVKILTDDTGRRLLAVSGRNVPAEYEVYYRVRFAVDVDGIEVVPVEQLALTRDFAYDETLVLGKAREEDSIREAIASDLVGIVTRRLTAVH